MQRPIFKMPSSLTHTLTLLRSQTDMKRPHLEILAALDRWASGWEDPVGPAWTPIRQRAECVPALEDAIRTLAESARLPAMRKLIREQLGHGDALERFVARPVGGWRMAAGYPLIGVFLGGGASLASWSVFLMALAAGSKIAVRMSESDRVWPLLLQQSLAAVDSDLASRIYAGYWPVSDAAKHRALCESADVVIAYGSDEAVSAIRDLVPAVTPFLPFGSRLSLGVVCEGVDIDEAAGHAAVDLALYDGAGCLSPQAFLIEGGREQSRGFAHALHRELSASRSAAPTASRSAATLAAIRRERDLARFEEDPLVLGPEDAAWTVIETGSRSFSPSPGGCTVQVRAFDSAGCLREMLRPYGSILQAVGLCAASQRQRLRWSGVLRDAGATRICPLGKMQMPTLAWSHDGRAMLSQMVRFIDLEA